MRGTGRVVFAAFMLLIAGVINTLYGIGALSGATTLANDTRYLLTSPSALGSVLIILGIFQITGGFWLMTGAAYGRVVGVIAGSLGAIGALLSIGGRHPWWSLAVFSLCVYVVHRILVFDEERAGQRRVTGGA
jgi:hypothetical protein